MIYKFANFAAAALAAGISAASTSLTVSSGAGALFPALTTDEGFRAIIYSGSSYEWITVTARTGDVMTIVRGTPARAFSAGARIELRLDATVLSSFLQKGTYRQVLSSPDGVLAGEYFGEEVLQSSTGQWWKNCGSTDWVVINAASE